VSNIPPQKDRAYYEELKLKHEAKNARLETRRRQRDLDLNLEKEKFILDKAKTEAEQRRQRFDNIKSTFALVVSLLSIGVTAYMAYLSIQTNREISREATRQKQVERVDKLKAEYSTASNDRKAAIAEYFKNIPDSTLVSRTEREGYKSFWTAYYTRVNADEATAKETNETIQKMQASITKTDIEKLKKTEVAQLNLENSLSQTKDSAVRAGIREKISAVKANVSPVGKLVDSLSQTRVAITQFEKGAANVQSEVTWIKERYFRLFGAIKVLLVDLNPSRNSGTVRISSTESPEVINLTFTSLGKKNFFYANKLYEIDFVKIDRAGNNPFTKAVYFSFTPLDSAGKTSDNSVGN
jgi:hypothetical protein